MSEGPINRVCQGIQSVCVHFKRVSGGNGVPCRGR